MSILKTRTWNSYLETGIRATYAILYLPLKKTDLVIMGHNKTRPIASLSRLSFFRSLDEISSIIASHMEYMLLRYLWKYLYTRLLGLLPWHAGCYPKRV